MDELRERLRGDSRVFRCRAVGLGGLRGVRSIGCARRADRSMTDGEGRRAYLAGTRHDRHALKFSHPQPLSFGKSEFVECPHVNPGDFSSVSTEKT